MLSKKHSHQEHAHTCPNTGDETLLTTTLFSALLSTLLLSSSLLILSHPCSSLALPLLTSGPLEHPVEGHQHRAVQQVLPDKHDVFPRFDVRRRTPHLPEGQGRVRALEVRTVNS